MRRSSGVLVVVACGAALSGCAKALGVRSFNRATSLDPASEVAPFEEESGLGGDGEISFPCGRGPIDVSTAAKIVRAFEYSQLPAGIEGVPPVAPEPMRVLDLSNKDCFGFENIAMEPRQQAASFAPDERSSFVNAAYRFADGAATHIDFGSDLLRPGQMSLLFTSIWNDTLAMAARQMAAKNSKCESGRLAEEWTHIASVRALRSCWSFTENFKSALAEVAAVATNSSESEETAMEVARQFLVRFGYYFTQSVYLGTSSTSFTYETRRGAKRRIPLLSHGASKLTRTGLYPRAECQDPAPNHIQTASIDYLTYFHRVGIANETEALGLLRSYMWSGRFFRNETLGGELERVQIMHKFRDNVKDPKPC